MLFNIKKLPGQEETKENKKGWLVGPSFPIEYIDFNYWCKDTKIEQKSFIRQKNDEFQFNDYQIIKKSTAVSDTNHQYIIDLAGIPVPVFKTGI